MDININKQNFDRLVDSLTRKERLLIATELCVASDSRLSSPLIPGALISEIVKVRTRILVKRKVSTWSLWKLWVFAMKPEGDLKNWRMTTNQCYRLRPRQRSVTGNLYRTRPRTSQRRSMRPRIYDCNGNVVPRRWLDRFAPNIKTQADWDLNSVIKNPGRSRY
jgi:hypothetical protein